MVPELSLPSERGRLVYVKSNAGDLFFRIVRMNNLSYNGGKSMGKYGGLLCIIF